MAASRAPRLASLAAAALLASVLAGCTSSGDGGSEGSSSSSSSTGPAPVVAVLSWHVRAHEEGGNATPGTNATLVEAGTVLAFEASGSSGPIASYSWSFGDNATSANKRAEHAYAAAGVYDVTLTVSSLANATSTASTQVQVVSSAGALAFVHREEVSGELPVMNPNSCTTQDVDCRDHVVAIVGADANGTAVAANRVRVDVTGASALPGAAMQVFWKAPDGTTLAQTEADGLEHSLEFAGTMGPGDYVLRVRLFTGAQVSYTGTVDVTYVTT